MLGSAKQAWHFCHCESPWRVRPSQPPGESASRRSFDLPWTLNVSMGWESSRLLRKWYRSKRFWNILICGMRRETRSVEQDPPETPDTCRRNCLYSDWWRLALWNGWAGQLNFPKTCSSKNAEVCADLDELWQELKFSRVNFTFFLNIDPNSETQV